MTYRILHVLDHSIPLHSGYTFRTAAILREQRKLGWETFHMTGPKQGASALQEEEVEVEGLHFFRTDWKAKGLARFTGFREFSQMRSMERRMGEIVERVRPNIIQAHSPVLNAIPALRTGKRHNIPVVYEIRAFWEDAAVDHGTATEGGVRYRMTRAIETYALRHADHATTICEGLRGDIIGRGIRAEGVTIIPNAVDMGSFKFQQAPDDHLRAILGLSGQTVLGFIGSFYAYEGLDLLLRALAQVLSKYPNVHLLLVGGGPQDEFLKKIVLELGLNKKVTFTGRVPHGEVQRYYSIIDVLVYPRYAMRLTDLVTPLKPLEAMAQGIVLVASDVGGHRELIQDGETGILFRAGDADSLTEAVFRMIRERADWPRFRTNGRSFVERERSWAASVGRYEPVYRGLTKKISV